MLRPRSGRVDPFIKPEERQINILPAFGLPRVEPQGESIAIRRERSEREAKTEQAEIARIASRYIEATKRYGVGRSLDFARANDAVLRTLIRRPMRDRTTLSRWLNDLRKEMDRVIVSSGTLDAKTRSEIIDRRDVAMAKSMDQLIPFIESVRRTSPGDILATGVELDVNRGIDLLRARPRWEESTQQLLVSIDLYQAKAGAVDDDGLRALAEGYLLQAQAAQNELDVDPEWFSLRGREQTEMRQMSVDELFAILSGENEVPTGEAELSPLGRFKSRTDFINQLNELARQLGESEVEPPTVALEDLDFRLLVKKTDGTNLDVSLIDALARAAA